MRMITFIHVSLVSLFEGAGMIFALDMARKLMLAALDRGGVYLFCFIPALYLIAVALTILVDAATDFYIGFQTAIMPDEDEDSTGP